MLFLLSYVLEFASARSSQNLSSVYSSPEDRYQVIHFFRIRLQRLSVWNIIHLSEVFSACRYEMRCLKLCFLMERLKLSMITKQVGGSGGIVPRIHIVLTRWKKLIAATLYSVPDRTNNKEQK